MGDWKLLLIWEKVPDNLPIEETFPASRGGCGLDHGVCQCLKYKLVADNDKVSGCILPNKTVFIRLFDGFKYITKHIVPRNWGL